MIPDRRSFRWRVEFLLRLCALASCPAFAEPALEYRTSFIECGRTQVRARAECFESSALCVTETLSFSRRNGRLIVPLHLHYTEREIASKKVKTLDFRASAWACIPGTAGGHYLVVAMRHADRTCAECAYTRLYNPDGRLIATDFAFDGAGHGRPNAAGRDTIEQVLGEPARHRFMSVYRE